MKRALLVLTGFLLPPFLFGLFVAVRVMTTPAPPAALEAPTTPSAAPEPIPAPSPYRCAACRDVGVIPVLVNDPTDPRGFRVSHYEACPGCSAGVTHLTPEGVPSAVQ